VRAHFSYLKANIYLEKSLQRRHAFAKLHYAVTSVYSSLKKHVAG
jgi:hypothetical protein